MFHLATTFILSAFTVLGGLLGLIVFDQLKFYHKAVILDDAHVKAISELSSDLSTFWSAFNDIAVERVAGSAGHAKVQRVIKKSMGDLGWEVTEDSFKAQTPMGVLPFNNIIATHNPEARRFLVFACHYDSKYFPDIRFTAAVDSAAPCAMMIQIAKNLNEKLEDKKNNDLSLRLIFFDGEEAFVKWSEEDSLYGARHLAEKWENEPYPEGGGDSNELDRIDMLVLLDLLGAKNPTFYNFFSNTQNWYKMLVGAEDKLKRGRLLKSHSSAYFRKMSTLAAIEDDHVPFLQKNVPILHVIPVPFPKEWHTAGDSREIIDEPTVGNLVRIFSTFVAEYLHLHS